MYVMYTIVAIAFSVFRSCIKLTKKRVYGLLCHGTAPKCLVCCALKAPTQVDYESERKKRIAQNNTFHML